MRVMLLVGLMIIGIACVPAQAETTPGATAPLSHPLADQFCAALLSNPLSHPLLLDVWLDSDEDKWALPQTFGPIVVACLEFAKGSN